MHMSLVVLEPGLASRIVDAGRPRSRSLGVPVGGAADYVSFALGNSLVGNLPEIPALEIALKGPRLRATSDVGCVLFGAPFEAECDGKRIETGRTFTLREGEELRIGGTADGSRAYLCVRGGFAAPTILQSQSSLTPLRGGETLACEPSRIVSRFAPEVMAPFLHDYFVSALPGPQASWFDETQFFEKQFVIAPASNRMGLRLQGQALTMPQRELVSEPVAPGAVQVTPDGQCIVLGVDGQTIGGYPKIAHVIQAHLPWLGQIRPGDRLFFSKIDMPLAVRIDRNRLDYVRHWAARLRLSLDAFPAVRP
jgi:5-oxoprolinase (ATP-hydrolysing) subunit C